jgi:hypothetical protein
MQKRRKEAGEKRYLKGRDEWTKELLKIYNL